MTLCRNRPWKLLLTARSSLVFPVRFYFCLAFLFPMAGFFFQSPFPSGHCLSVLASGLCSLSPQSTCLPEPSGPLSLLFSGISPDILLLLPVSLLKLLRQSEVPKPQLLLTLSPLLPRSRIYPFYPTYSWSLHATQSHCLFSISA